MVDENKLGPYAKTLMKALGGNASTLSPTVTAKSITRWKLDDPTSFLNIVGEGSFRELVLLVPAELDKYTEHMLETAMDEKPSRVDKRVKIRLWQEYEEAAMELRPMNMDKCVEGTGAPSWSQYESSLVDPIRVAWLTRPPVEYRLAMKEAEQTGLKRLMEILELPMVSTNRDGAPFVNVGVGLLILQAFKLVDQRVNGMVAQRMVNVNLNQSIPKDATSISMENIDAKIKELEEKVGVASDSGRLIDLEKL